MGTTQEKLVIVILSPYQRICNLKIGSRCESSENKLATLAEPSDLLLISLNLLDYLCPINQFLLL